MVGLSLKIKVLTGRGVGIFIFRIIRTLEGAEKGNLFQNYANTVEKRKIVRNPEQKKAGIAEIEERRGASFARAIVKVYTDDRKDAPPNP